MLSLDADGAKVSGPVEPASKPSIKRRLSPARGSWLYVSRASKLDEKQRLQVEQIRLAKPDLDTAYQLTQTFVSMLAEHQDTDLDEWLVQAEHSGIRELKSFAHGIRRDYAAVRAAFTSPWSNARTTEASYRRPLAAYQVLRSAKILPLLAARLASSLYGQMPRKHESSRMLFPLANPSLKQEVALRQWQNGCRVAGQQFTIRTHFISFGIDLDIRCRVIVNHARLPNSTAILNSNRCFAKSEFVR